LVFTSEKICGDFSFSQYNIKSAAGVSHMQEGAIGKALAQRHGHFRVSTQRC